MDLGLKGRGALVAAASKGLGRACAEALIGEGAEVFISSRDAIAIESTAKQIGASGLVGGRRLEAGRSGSAGERHPLAFVEPGCACRERRRSAAGHV